MKELGYVEGRDIDIVYRYANGDFSRMPGLANELAWLEPAVFVPPPSPLRWRLGR